MITLTEKAVKELKRLLIKESSNLNTFLRIQVIGGGCSGLSYKLQFDQNEPKPDDKSFLQDEIKILIDKKSLIFLSGTTLDFSDGLNGTGFEFKNPNSKKTCGCGSSFSV